MRDDVAKQDYLHIVAGVWQRGITCAEEAQDRVEEQETEDGEHHADDNVQHHHVAQHPLRRVIVFLSEPDGYKCCRTHAYQ